MEQHAAELDTPAWQLAAARAGFGWPQGQLLTRAEYQQGLHDTLQQVMA